KLETAGIRTIVIPELLRDINFSADLKSLLALVKILRQEKPDVIHLNSTKIGGLGSVAGRLASVPKIIYTAHGWASNEDRTPIKKIVMMFFEWLTALLCDRVITVAGREFDQAKGWPGIKRKLSRIYNGIGPVSFLTRDEARPGLCKKNPSLTEHQSNIWIGSVAELHPNKGLDILIEAVHDIAITHAGFSVVLIGDGEEFNALEKIIRERNLSSVVHLLGRVDNARDYLKAFDIFALPSRKEGFPYALLEAGAAGLPVVTTKVGGIPEIITDQETGILIEPKNKEALAEALLSLLTDSKLRDKLGSGLQQKVQREFALETMISQTRQLY
ncbi:MAG TPA: glycosyltransferase, partial [Candidatus Paceibacterota bacterium]|nr:glycosyltransferase [Candidatus Paceibacterota bacterium]